MNLIVASPSNFGFRLLLLGRLRADSLLLLAELGCECLTEVLRLEHLPDLDLGSPVEGSALQPLDRLFPRLHLPQPEAGDELLRLREGSVDHGPLASVESDPHAFRARLES